MYQPNCSLCPRAVVLTLLLLCPPALAAIPYYSITDLGSLAGPSVARSINNLGQVVGTYESGLGKTSAFLWTPNAGLVDLPGVGGDNTFAYDINNAGQIVGGAEGSSGGALHAMLWDLAANPTDINPGPDYYSTAYAINNNGRAVLQAGLTADTFGTRLVLWDAATGFTDRGTLEGTNAIAWDINNFNEVALMWEARGIRWDILGQPSPAFSWDPEYGLFFIPPPEGSRSGNSYAINSMGQVVGAFAVMEEGATELIWKAFLFTPSYPFGSSERPYFGRGEVTYLGTLGGDAIPWGIYGRDIVGASTLLDGELHAFLSAPETDEGPRIMSDLNTLLINNPGWVLREAYSSNGVGQIVGWGVNPQGEERAFLLNPIPEPAAAALLAFGLLTLLRRR